MIVFDDMIADMLSNKQFNPLVTELFITGRKINIYFVFITQSYFAVPKNITLNSTHHFNMKIQYNSISTQHKLKYKFNINKRELQQIAFNHS